MLKRRVSTSIYSSSLLLGAPNPPPDPAKKTCKTSHLLFTFCPGCHQAFSCSPSGAGPQCTSQSHYEDISLTFHQTHAFQNKCNAQENAAALILLWFCTEFWPLVLSSLMLAGRLSKSTGSKWTRKIFASSDSVFRRDFRSSFATPYLKQSEATPFSIFVIALGGNVVLGS